MTLSVSKLKTELLKIMDPTHSNWVGFPSTPAQAAANWTDAYHTYAADAEDFSGDSPLSVLPAAFEAVLASEWASYNGSFALGAESLANAWAAYWTGGTFAIGGLISGTGSGGCANVGSGNKIFGTEISSVVTVVNPSPLESALLSILTDVDVDVDSRAEDLAGAFHSATINNITVLISGIDTTPPPMGPQPVTNTCQVF